MTYVYSLGKKGFNYFIKTSVDYENNVYLVGNISINKKDSHGIFIKLDENKNVIWKKYIYNEDHKSVFLNDVIFSPIENCIYVFGYNKLLSNGYSKLIVSKWKNNGELIWIKKLNNDVDCCIKDSIIVEEENKLYIYGAGFDYNLKDDQYEPILIKFDCNGNIIWIRKIKGSNDDYFYSITFQIEEDNLPYIYTCGNSTSATKGKNINALIVKWNKNGEIVWKKNSICNNNSIKQNFISIDSDGKYIYICGGESYLNLESKGNLIKIDKNCNIIWKKNITYSDNYNIRSIFNGIKVLNDEIYTVGYNYQDVEKINGLIVKWNKETGEILSYKDDIIGEKEFVFLNTNINKNNIYCVGYEKTNKYDIIAKLIKISSEDMNNLQTNISDESQIEFVDFNFNEYESNMTYIKK